MKPILISFFLFFFSKTLIAQNITLAQILEIKKKDLGSAEEFLTAKGWEFTEGIEPADGKLGTATFAYNKFKNKINGVDSFLTFMYSDYSNKTRIAMTIFKKEKYNEYINSIKSFGCKLISSKVENGAIIKIYRGQTTTFYIESRTYNNYDNESSSEWNISVVSNNDFNTMSIEK
jgi:hypothetical protein